MAWREEERAADPCVALVRSAHCPQVRHRARECVPKNVIRHAILCRRPTTPVVPKIGPPSAPPLKTRTHVARRRGALAVRVAPAVSSDALIRKIRLGPPRIHTTTTPAVSIPLLSLSSSLPSIVPSCSIGQETLFVLSHNEAPVCRYRRRYRRPHPRRLGRRRGCLQGTCRNQS